MLKKLLLILLIVAPLSVFAQDKFAYVNAGEVFQKMPELKEIETKLATERETIQKNATAIQTELQKKFEEYQGLPEGTSASVRGDMEKQLQQIQERLENFQQSSGTEYQNKQQSLIAPVQQKLMQAIKEVGDEGGYAYIIDQAQLLYVSTTATDLTAKVKTKLGITN